jgi:hypothetical protein
MESKRILLENRKHGTRFELKYHGSYRFISELDVKRINHILCPSGCCQRRRILCDEPPLREMAAYIDGLYLLED